MLGALVVVSMLSAAPVKSLAAPGFQCVNLDAKLVESFMVHFAQQLGERGFQVTTPQEVATLLGMERQKQLLACTDEGCNAEIAAALGVDALITGNLGKVGSGYLINIKVIRSKDASTLAVFSGRPKTDDEVLDFLEASAKKFAAQYAPNGQAPVVLDAPPPSAVSAAPRPGPRIVPWVTGGAAVVALAVGGVFIGLAQSSASDLRAGKGSDLLALQKSGQLQETLGYSLLGAGGALAVATALVWFLGAPEQPHVAVLPLHDGAAFALWGSL